VTCSSNVNFPKNSNKRIKSNSYRKHFYNCLKMVHVGLHSVETYHKKFGWQNKKIKIYFAECPRQALGKAYSAECQTVDTRTRLSANITIVSFTRRLTTVCQAPHFAECFTVPRVLLSTNTIVTESRTLPSTTLYRVPDKKHSANHRALDKDLDPGSAYILSELDSRMPTRRISGKLSDSFVEKKCDSLDKYHGASLS
jgi:hypothetical protein